MNGISCRLLVDPPAAGSWNMAVDDVVLHSAAEQGICSLRFYEWAQPTLSLGYFQAYEERQNHVASRGCALIRRATGGGAILHHHELTYSIALARSQAPRDSLELYRGVHQSLIGALLELGVAEAPQLMSKSSETREFLCFQRRAAGDVVLKQVKICGSAQRRTAGAVLQHGSVLLARSEHAPELPGLAEMAGRSISAFDLQSAWERTIADELELGLRPGSLTAVEASEAVRIAQSRYEADAWLRRR